ncbi:MAG: hypothetical protein R2854_00985 [Caldilineaceae bacterium]
MTQLFIGLIEPEAARAWLMEYAVRFPAVTELMDLLLELTGMHPLCCAASGTSSVRSSSTLRRGRWPAPRTPS